MTGDMDRSQVPRGHRQVDRPVDAGGNLVLLGVGGDHDGVRGTCVDLERMARAQFRHPLCTVNHNETRPASGVGFMFTVTVYVPACTSGTVSVPSDCGLCTSVGTYVETVPQLDGHPRGAFVLLAGYGRVILPVGDVEAAAVPDDVELAGRSPWRQRVASDDL